MAAQPRPELSPWIGTLKTFGPAGPMYEVVGPTAITSNGQEMLTIRVFGTGELVEYPLEELIADPEAV